jgi:hypothetical protein
VVALTKVWRFGDLAPFEVHVAERLGEGAVSRRFLIQRGSFTSGIEKTRLQRKLIYMALSPDHQQMSKSGQSSWDRNKQQVEKAKEERT